MTTTTGKLPFHPRLLSLLEQHNPKSFETIIEILDYESHEIDREVYEGSLIEFFKRAWQEIDPARLKVNWHHEALAEHLEAVAFGEIKKLLINIPPGCTKTNLASVCFPAWVWAQPGRGPLIGPQAKFMSITYGDALSKTIARLSRRLLTSGWYQGLWGDRVKFEADQIGLEDMGNTAGGFRIATSIGGATLGRRGDCLIIDDPHKVDEAESDIERQNVIDAYDEALATRVTDPSTVAEIIIMQRLHEGDLSGHVLDKYGSAFTHLCLPMEFEPTLACAADIRTRDCELLWPGQWTREAVEALKIRLGTYAAAGQLQQTPTPRAGGIIGRTDWNVWPEEPPDPAAVRTTASGEVLIELPPVSYVILTLDTAMSERETADWNACVVWGVWHRRRNAVRGTVGVERPWFADRWASIKTPADTLQQVIEDDDQPRAIMMEAWRRRCKLNDETPDAMGKPSGLVQRVLDTARRRKASMIVIENKTRGKDVADELKRQMRNEEFQIHMFDPGRHGDKVARLHSVQPLYSQGLVYAPGKYEVVTDATGRTYCEVRQEFVWVETVMKEISAVPRSKHDDLSDCCSMGLIFLRENGFLELTKEFIQESVRQRMVQLPRAAVGQAYGVT
jgi:phage terminase large subunit-like protein